jgi:hypothetical protein
MSNYLEAELKFISTYRRLQLKNGITPADTLASTFLVLDEKKEEKYRMRELHRERSQLIEQICIELQQSPAASLITITPKRKNL